MTFSVNRIHVAEMFGLCTAGSLIYNLTVLNSFATNSLSSVGDTNNCAVFKVKQLGQANGR